MSALVRSDFFFFSSSFVPLSSQIRIRDPNQGGKDITEEIMAGGSGSRNSTPPVGPPSSTPTPPQVWLTLEYPHSPLTCSSYVEVFREVEGFIFLGCSVSSLLKSPLCHCVCQTGSVYSAILPYHKKLMRAFSLECYMPVVF